MTFYTSIDTRGPRAATHSRFPVTILNQPPRAPTLSRREVRQLVAEMLG